MTMEDEGIDLGPGYPTLADIKAADDRLEACRRRIAAAADTYKIAVDTESVTATPGSIVSATTVVDPSPTTPYHVYGKGKYHDGHKISDISIIANGHPDSDSAGDADDHPHHSGEEEDPFVAGEANTETAVVKKPLPRIDRDASIITAENAQAFLPSDACVFVANLLALKSDDTLAAAVQDTFSVYGQCYTKIRRDPKGMPFAFVQYHSSAQAERAIVNGRNTLIEGRPCRTERAKVPRALYLSRMSGGPIGKEEACSILEGHGAIESLWHPTPTDREMFRLPEGIWIVFAYFNDARDAQSYFRTSQQYRLEQPPLPEELKAQLEGSNASTSVIPQMKQTPMSNRKNTVARPAEHECCSLFIGNLSFNSNPQQISQEFGKHGVITGIEIVFRVRTVHAFITYQTFHQADAALYAEHVVNGRRLRVERRMSTPNRSNSNTSQLSNGSPNARGSHNKGSASIEAENRLHRPIHNGAGGMYGPPAPHLVPYNPQYGYMPPHPITGPEYVDPLMAPVQHFLPPPYWMVPGCGGCGTGICGHGGLYN